MNKRILTVFCLFAFLSVVLFQAACSAALFGSSPNKNKDALVSKFCTSKDVDYTVLAYGEQKDDILKETYSFLIFQEVDRTDASAWSVRVVSNFLTASRITPDNQKMLADKLGKGKEFVTFGSPFVAPKGDKRVVEYRYYPKKKMAEVFVALRDQKRNAKNPVIIKANPPVWK